MSIRTVEDRLESLREEIVGLTNELFQARRSIDELYTWSGVPYPDCRVPDDCRGPGLDVAPARPTRR